MTLVRILAPADVATRNAARAVTKRMPTPVAILGASHEFHGLQQTADMAMGWVGLGWARHFWIFGGMGEKSVPVIVNEIRQK
jgi:hypothetical protein